MNRLYTNRLDSFWSKVDTSGECWEWTAYIKENGYGQFMWKGKPYYAHRFSYEFYKGEIPNELCIDHLCRNRKCVNPDHLEAVTTQVNNLRGEGPTAINANKTHCNKGHEFVEENIYYYVRKNGKDRRCRICINRRQREYNQRVKLR